MMVQIGFIIRIMSLAKFINSIATDKKDHLILGVITGFPLVILFGNIGGIIAIILYALKEIIHDKIQGKGTPSFLDWWYNSIPIIQYLILINL
mgnify:FL=1